MNFKAKFSFYIALGETIQSKSNLIGYMVLHILLITYSILRSSKAFSKAKWVVLTEFSDFSPIDGCLKTVQYAIRPFHKNDYVDVIFYT